MKHCIRSSLVLKIMVAEYAHSHNAGKWPLLLFRIGGPELAAPLGWVFEAVAHGRLRYSLPLQAIPMEKSGDEWVHGSHSTPVHLYHHSPTDVTIYGSHEPTSSTVSPDTYYIPMESDNPSFDSFLHYGFSSIAFQMTLGRSPSMKARGINSLRSRFCAYRKHVGSTSKEPWAFVFVIYRGSDFTIPLDAKPKDFQFFTAEIDPEEGSCPC